MPTLTLEEILALPEDLRNQILTLIAMTKETDPDPPGLQERAKQDFLRHLAEDGGTYEDDDV